MEPKPAYNAQTAPGRSGVMSEVATRCSKNDEQWGGPAHDDLHHPSDWISLIDNQIFEAESGDMNFRDRMIKIAALAIQAVESHDRKYIEPIDAR